MKSVAAFLVCVFLIFQHICYASERNTVMSTINNDYYCEDLNSVIEAISEIDTSMRDEEYLKSVFSCLDEHSEYYTPDEYVSQLVTGNSGMISASLYKNEIEVKINRFADGAEDTFFEYADKCEQEGIRKLTLDLTECPGGYVHVMNAIANVIMPKGRIMIAKFKNSERVYCSESEKCPFDEIIVKVSSHTASAAEILAAGLQDSGAAKVVGVNTYGKTSIQSLHRLESGAAFKITSGEYLTRNGSDISKTGVIPDIVDYSYPIKIRWNDCCKEILKNNEAVGE